jgi:predicted aldo/keto reductase-like oxidoreductase
MTDAELREMGEIRKELGAKFCHRCDYCQPCTSEIPISLVLAGRSFFKRLPPERFFGDMVAPAMKKASQCSGCGNCEERCPYHLPIREMLAEHVEWFADLKRKYREATGCV